MLPEQPYDLSPKVTEEGTQNIQALKSVLQKSKVSLTLNL